MRLKSWMWYDQRAIVEKVACETRFFQGFGSQRRKSTCETRFFLCFGSQRGKSTCETRFPLCFGSQRRKSVCETRFSLCFGSQRRKSAPETRVLWIFMLNMMENEGNWVWRGYFCRTDPFWKNASTKVRTESQIKPRKWKGKWIDFPKTFVRSE